MLGQNSFLTDGNHNFRELDKPMLAQGYQFKPLKIADDAVATSKCTILADMGEPPDRSYTLERDDNNKGYEPGNVRWATRSEQRANSRTGTVGSRHGRSKLTERDVEIIRSSPLNCAQLGRAFGVVPSVISGIRLRRSWRHVP